MIMQNLPLRVSPVFTPVTFEVICIAHLEPVPGAQVPSWETPTSLRHCPLLQAPTNHPEQLPGLNMALGLLWLCPALFQKQMEQRAVAGAL